MTTTATAADDIKPPDDPNLLAALNVATIIVRDLDGTIRFWSKGAERLYGWSPAEALGQRSHELLATTFAEPLEAIQARLLREGTWRGELNHRTRDGGTVFVASQWALQRAPDGQPSGIVEINNDIGFQQQALAAVRQLAAIVESSNDAIVGKTLDGVVTAWNRAAEAMFGWQTAEMIGQPVARLFPPDRLAEEVAILDHVRRGERVAPYETARLRKDGIVIPVLVTVSPIRDNSGAIVGASKIARDLTPQRESDQRLREAQAELFHVQRLTELGQLVSALVHEVNQPLAAIGNYAAAGRRLLAGGQASGAGAALQKIGEQTERAHQIIQRLRNFVKKGDIARRAEHLPTLVQEALALATVSFTKEHVTFETNLDSAAARVVADRVQIQQVLFNLLRNALEAMEHSPRCAVRITAGLDAAGMVEIEVADTGPCLPPEVSASLFRPFVTTKDNGMGVGLSICRSIVELHGGRLWSEDNPGGGAVFRFTLPQAPDSVEITPT